MEKSNFEKMFYDVISGKSIRECEKNYGINRKSFTDMCKQFLPIGSLQRMQMEQFIAKNKSELQKKQIEDKKLRTIIEGLISGKVKSKLEALEILDGSVIEVQTLNEKITNYINESNDQDLKARYIGYLAKKNPDYSNINFKALIIEMIREQYSQNEIAAMYNIPARRISREVEKLKKEEGYQGLYDIAKELANRNMKNGPVKYRDKALFSPFEWKLIETQIDEFDEGPIIIEDAKSDRECKYEKAKDLIKAVEEIPLSQKEAAKKLGVSVSTIRRAKIYIENYERLYELGDRE